VFAAIKNLKYKTSLLKARVKANLAGIALMNVGLMWKGL